MWIKLDTGFFSHPKALAAGRDGRDLWLAGLCWSASQETDGRIPAHALGLIALLAGVPDADQTASRLVEVGLWANDVDGWVIHSYSEWQTTKAERDLWKAKERARKQTSRSITKTSETTATVRDPSARTMPGIRALDVDVDVDKTPHLIGAAISRYSQPQPTDEDERLDKAMRHLAALLAQRAQATQPVRYAATVYQRGEQRPQLTALAQQHPNDTPEQLAQRWLNHPGPAPAQCDHCHATTHPTNNCPTQDT